MPVPAAEYHERTKHSPASVRAGGHRLDWDNKPIPYKIYDGPPTVRLDEAVGGPEVPALRAVARSSGPAGPSDHPPVDLDAITRLCQLSSGITKVLTRGGREHPFRAAACTGALYHIDLYLVAGDVPASGGDGDPGVDAGVYHFDPRGPALDVLREGDYRGVLAEAAGDHPDVAEAPLSVVLTSTWWRNAWKYGERTYRHAFWDSGTITANLLAVAHALDLPASVVTGFADPTVADLLGVSPRTEGPVAVVPVGTGDPVPDPRPLDPVDHETVPLSPDPVEYDLIGDAYEASALPRGEAARNWRQSAPDGPIVSRGPGDGEVVALDPPADGDAPTTPLDAAIRRRGSCREYAREALDVRSVSAVLDRAVRGVPMDVTPAGASLALNDCYLIVNGVEGVEPGAYQLHPGGGDGRNRDGGGRAGVLERLQAGEFRREAGHLALDQRLAADAALCAFFLTDLDAVTGQLGDRGYRAAQLEAAVTAGRLYLAAYAHDREDVGATGLTFYDDEVTEFFSPRAAGETPTFLWTMGRPA